MRNEVKSRSRRAIPGVNKVLDALGSCDLPRPIIVDLVRRELSKIRAKGEIPEFQSIVHLVQRALEGLRAGRLLRVVNGTGIVIHTNFGRAPLAPEVVGALSEIGSGYSNLEYDVATGERLYTMSEPQDGLNTIALSPTGKFVAAGGLDKTIRIWSLGPKGGTLVNSLIAHEDAILKLAYSPDGKLLASSGADRTIKIFKADDLTEIKTLDHQPDWVMSLEFSPDGKTFAAGRYDGSLEIYNVGQLSNGPARQARTLAPNVIH